MKNFIHYDFAKLTRETSPDGSRIYITPSGSKYPSVTTVTGMYKKDSIEKWRLRVGDEEANRVSKKATDRGTRIHTLCEEYLLGKNPVVDMFDHDMFSSIKYWLEDIDNIHCLETPLYSDFLQVAGTVDCIAEFQGKLSVIDFKTSSRPKEKEDIADYFMQCSAYAVAFEEMTGIPIGRLVIIMGVDNDYSRMFIEKRDNHIAGFRKLRLEYRNKYNI